MADGRKNNGGKRAGAGAKGYGHISFIKSQVELHSKDWWTTIVKMFKSKKVDEKKFALAEFNKIQVKMIPQEVTGEGGGPINLNLIQYGNNPAVQLPAENVSTTLPKGNG